MMVDDFGNPSPSPAPSAPPTARVTTTPMTILDVSDKAASGATNAAPVDAEVSSGEYGNLTLRERNDSIPWKLLRCNALSLKHRQY